MNSITRKSDSSQPAAETAVYLFDDWFDPIETGVRDRVREFIQAMVEGELDAALMRPRYGRRSQFNIKGAVHPFVIELRRMRGGVAGVVGIEGGVVSGVINLESSDVGASDWRPRHEQHYQEV